MLNPSKKISINNAESEEMPAYLRLGRGKYYPASSNFHSAHKSHKTFQPSPGLVNFGTGGTMTTQNSEVFNFKSRSNNIFGDFSTFSMPNTTSNTKTTETSMKNLRSV
jgi:hypothetical protein